MMANRKQQWFLLWFVMVWLLAALVMPVVAFCLTGNPLSLSFFSTLAPPSVILYRITKTLFPPGDNETKIAQARSRRKKPSP